jgi:tetratricopeptide (TPR) repeat protein
MTPGSSGGRVEGLALRLARRAPGRWLLRAVARVVSAPAAHRALLGFESHRLNWCAGLEHARAVLRVEPEDLATRVALGRILVRLGFNDDAIDAFEAVIAREPLHPEARRQLGALYRRRERHADARRCFEVLSADHDAPRGKALLARVLEEEGRLEPARELRLSARAQLAGGCAAAADNRRWAAHAPARRAAAPRDPGWGRLGRARRAPRAGSRPPRWRRSRPFPAIPTSPGAGCST